MSVNTVTTTVALGGGSPQNVGTAATDLIGFYGATAVARPSGSAQNAVTDNSGGTSADTIAVGCGYQLLTVRLTLAELANSQEYQFDPGYAGKLVSINARVITAATTGSKAATVTGRVNAGALGGGGVVALTSSNCTPIGAQVAGSAVTGANAFTAAQTVGFTVGTVTTFVEGAVVIEMVLQNTDMTAAIAKLSALANALRSASVTSGLIKGAA